MGPAMGSNLDIHLVLDEYGLPEISGLISQMNVIARIT